MVEVSHITNDTAYTYQFGCILVEGRMYIFDDIIIKYMFHQGWFLLFNNGKFMGQCQYCDKMTCNMDGHIVIFY